MLILAGGTAPADSPIDDTPEASPDCAPRRLTVDPGDPRLSYSGRWTPLANDAAEVSWAGASVRLVVRGTRVMADIDTGRQEEQFRVVVDGQASDQVLVAGPGRATVELIRGLDPERSHTVELVKETYTSDRTRLYGFRVEGCEVLPAPRPPPRRIAFFGDSNMDGTSLYDEKDGGDSGAWFAYPATVARMLDAEFSLQAFGGATLTGDADNSVLSFITAPRRDQSDPDYRDGFDPQVIVVNAGANDVFAVDTDQAAEREAEIRSRFAAVVERLRAVYGDAPHIILYNAYGWHLEEPANYTPAVAADLGGKLSAVRYPWIWEQFHGAMAEHGGQARFLAEAIAERVPGFAVVRPLDVIDGWGRNFDVANGGFEEVARSGFDAFGWRYAEDGVERIEDPEGAFEGTHYIRLEAGEEVHQGTEATGDFEPGPTGPGQRYELSARVRAPGGHGTARLRADFEGQAMYGRGQAQDRRFDIGDEWTEVRAVFTAPEGTWKTFVTLAADSGTVDFDAVRMQDPDR
jgi:lysophospholipase L1-like esterase